MYTRMLFAFVSTVAMLTLAASFSPPVRVANDALGKLHGVDPFVSEPIASEATSPDLTAVMLVAGLKTRGLASRSLPHVESQLRVLHKFLNDDTAHVPEGRETFLLSFALMALEHANSEGLYTPLIQQTVAKLKQAQWSTERACDSSDPRFGGTGFRMEAAPDLYHTSLAIEALRTVGVPASDAYMQRALQFVTRCQLVGSESNAESSRKTVGGFAIAPAMPNAQVSSGAQNTVSTAPPCGSLTCAGLKSLALCGVKKDDQRIDAALRWLGTNYTLKANPGMPNPRFRLYDYYWSFATAMTLLEIDVIVDSDRTRHNWRHELVSVLQSEQRRDGSWMNRAEAGSSREAHPFLTTSYAMITLHKIVNGSVKR